MSIAAANVAPNFAFRRQLVAADLKRLQEPAVIFEHEGVDSDGRSFFVYTVAGWLDGSNVATLSGGCTVGGEVILISALNPLTRAEADVLACMGLQDTIDALHAEGERYLDAQAALARLSTIGEVDRLEAATKPASDKSDAFVDDLDAVRPLMGDDIVLTVGGVH